MEYVDVVDKTDRIIGRSTAAICRKKGYIHRVVLIFVFDNKKRMLLQLRHKLKEHNPLHWTASAGGRVQSRETYGQGAIRELKEELGISADNMTFVGKNLYEDKSSDKSKKRRFFLASFVVQSNGPFKIEKNKVEKVEFFPVSKIKQMIKSNEKFQPEILYALKKRFDIN